RQGQAPARAGLGLAGGARRTPRPVSHRPDRRAGGAGSGAAAGAPAGGGLMGFAKTRGVTLSGVDDRVVTVEAQWSSGLPVFVMSGLADSACRQAPDRVRPAIRNLGVTLPQGRWTVNLSPAGLPKVGSGLDLAVAAALLASEGHLDPE